MQILNGKREVGDIQVSGEIKINLENWMKRLLFWKF